MLNRRGILRSLLVSFLSLLYAKIGGATDVRSSPGVK